MDAGAGFTKLPKWASLPVSKGAIIYLLYYKPQTSTYHVPVTPQPGWKILAVEACGPMHRDRCCERGPSGLELL